MKITYGFLIIVLVLFILGFCGVFNFKKSVNKNLHVKTLVSTYAIKVRVFCYNNQEFLIVNGSGTSSNQILDESNKPKKCDY